MLRPSLERLCRDITLRNPIDDDKKSQSGVKTESTVDKSWLPMIRTRRTHKKSRHGCLGCKQRRKKCDEATPRCSRCAEANAICEYPKRLKNSHLIAHLSRQAAITRHDTPSCLAPSVFVRCQLPLSISLSPTEIDHLGHYLTYTAPAIAFDEDDLFALQTGFPNLAFRNKPLMNSILALASVSKCRDILAATQLTSLQDQNNVCKLLEQGDAWHRASLHQTQEDILNTDYYECVLSNAPLMVLFAFASHSLRIRLATLLDGKGPLPSSFVPAQSQWISLIRAAHLAYTGFFDAETELSRDKPATSPASSDSYTAVPEWHEDGSYKDGPTEETRRLILPIIRETSTSALKRLSLKAQIVQESLKADVESSSDRCIGNNMESCLIALETLQSIMGRVFRDAGSSSPIPTVRNYVSTTARHQFHNPHVSPWLRHYLARVTSAAPPKPMRRIVTSFLNRVPAGYLNLVQSTIDTIPSQTSGVLGSHPDVRLSSTESPVLELAIDIFAHWLVLMMLLDGVWWIGETGTWELKRIISLVHSRGWCEETKANWWPESMHRVVTESKKYIIDET